MKKSFSVVLCATFLGSSGAHADSVSVGATTALNSFHAALKRGDGETAKSLLDPSATIFESGVAESRYQYQSHHLAGDMEFAKSIQVTIKKEDKYCVESLCTIARQSETTGSYKGKSINLSGTETAVLRLTGSAWKITHLHWSSKSNR